MEKRFSTKMNLPKYALSIPFKERVQFFCIGCDKNRYGWAQLSKRKRNEDGKPVYTYAICRVCSGKNHNPQSWEWKPS